MKKIRNYINSIKISGLHGYKTISLKLRDSVIVIVGENGSGKTTFLNILYFLLTKNWRKLLNINFKKISLKFANDEINIDRATLDTSTFAFKDRFSADLSYDQYYYLRNISRHSSYSRFRIVAQDILRTIDRHISSMELYEFLRNVGREDNQGDLFLNYFKEIEEKLDKNISFQTLYFPTYRRVEEDLKNLGFSIDEELERREQLIHFGMQDVQERFDKITKEIKDSYTEWFTVITSKILSQLTRKIDPSLIDYKSISDKETLSIVLDRLEREFSENEKELIINIIDNKEIFDDSHIYLALFLSNLIDVYKKQKTNDDSIKTFSTIVNEYLEDKEVFYDERKVEISIKDKKKKKAVKLENLSSGEKQIISLFSKLYLERTGDLAILIDEPELSLSLEWQKRLLVDIVKCPNVVLLVAATHSPFIFSNELDKFAQPLLS